MLRDQDDRARNLQPEVPVENNPNPAHASGEDLRTSDAIVDGRLMVLRRDGQLPRPIRGSLGRW